MDPNLGVPQDYFAHTRTNPDGSQTPKSRWEPLFTPFGECPESECQGEHCLACERLEPQHGHLNKVAYWSGKFARDMFVENDDCEQAARWGYLAGLWHDLGKFSVEFQDYLSGSGSDSHTGEVQGRVDHSTAGAAHAWTRSVPGALLSYAIAGHHAGLTDGDSLFSEGQRLEKEIPRWKVAAERAGVPLDLPIPIPPLRRPAAGNDAMAFMIRSFFSCLVDADFIATEAFMNIDRARLRGPRPDNTITQMLESLEDYLGERFTRAEESEVNLARNSVRRQCESAATNAPGFFSLTVPTGGGKTLSSLLFALRHAQTHSMRRIIYVIPFTSIIKQNADVFRHVFKRLSMTIGREIVLEHHSRFDPAKETAASRLAAENWDAPLIVTTNVQFFESLFGNRTSRCRKLHHTARSVVIFDEAQALPNQLLAPILRGLQCLIHDLNSTAVLCTATQPALEKRSGFDIGIPPEKVHEIIHDKEHLFQVLDRVTPRDLGQITDQDLVYQILEHAAQGCLLIVNTTTAAQSLYEQLKQHIRTFHLSARMCPRHVVLVLAQVKRLRQRAQPVVLVATQLIEAGVDISFPVVYRAECGVDSLAQAAGRCNRHGELSPAKGLVFHFQPTDHPIPKCLTDLTTNAAVTRGQVIPNFDENELLSLPAIRRYFEHAVWQAGLSTDKWDCHHIVSGDLPCFAPNSKSLHTYSFRTAAERFRLIESNTHSILVPWGRKGKSFEKDIRELKRFGRIPTRDHYRKAQQFTVQVYEDEWKRLQGRIELLYEGAIAILIHPENDYHPETGLKRESEPDEFEAYFI